MYLILVAALLFALAPVYWMLTISFKTEVEQFASPPPWFVFTPTLEHYYDAFVTCFWSVFANERDRCRHINCLCARHRYVSGVRTRAV